MPFIEGGNLSVVLDLPAAWQLFGCQKRSNLGALREFLETLVWFE